MDKDALLNQIALIIEEQLDDSYQAAADIWDLLGLEIAVKKPIVFGYGEHQGWLPGRKRLVSQWVEDEVMCVNCSWPIYKVGHLPWLNSNGEEGCVIDGVNSDEIMHAPKRS